MKSLFLLAFVLLSTAAGAAGPMAAKDVPPPLRPWLSWVLHGEDSRNCPFAHDDAGQRSCVWPGELTLDLDAGGGRFSYRVESFADGAWLALPGDAEHWPVDVRGRGGPLPVTGRDGVPYVRLPLGQDELHGRFAWSGLPRSLTLPKDAAIVQARVGGRLTALQPGDDGMIWLQSRSAEPAADSLATQVFRFLDDDVPMRMSAQFELGVAGQAREVVLPSAVLDGFTATSVDSPLPARLAEDGSLRVQVRPGNWRIIVGSRRGQPLSDVAMPAEPGWPEEVWAFRSRAETGQRTAAGGVAVDPRQIAIVDEWKALPAYRLLKGEGLHLQAGARSSTRAPDRLSLDRQVWLDFDGGGHTFQDRIIGELITPWRLETTPAVALGRVAVDGVDQPVTRLTAAGGAGVELRPGRIDVSAEGRIEGDVGSLPVSAWNADFTAVRLTVHTPPGWRLLHASGSDKTYGSWWSRWDLWAAFFVLLTAMAVGRLHGKVGGVIALAALVLSWHLDDAPQLLWPALVAVQALALVLPDGRLKRVAVLGGRLLLTVVLVIVAALVVTLARQSIHPSLEVAGIGDRRMEMPLPASAPSQAPQVMPMKTERAKSMASLGPDSAPQQARIDPAARVQTGPGLPAWHWHAYSLSWSGPIALGQEVSLWLAPPWITRLLNLTTVVLLAALLWLLGGRWRPRWPGAASLAPAALLAVFMLLHWPQPALASEGQTREMVPDAAADTPSDARLAELRRRLLQPADCLPACADVPEMALTADGQGIRLRLQVHALQTQMLPLPGRRGQFSATRVTVNGRPASLRRDEDGQVWLAVQAGVHDVLMEGAVTADSVQITLPLPPRRLQTALSGWTLSGVDGRGQAGSALTLARESRGRSAAGQPPASQLPPFIRVTRLLALADRWTVTTTLRRDGPSQVPAEIRVPLLAGESVTDAGIRVADGQAVVVVGPGSDVVFHSNVTQAADLHFVAARGPDQAETWLVDADGRWHVDHQGLDPLATAAAAPGGLEWRPWPGQELHLKVSRPAAIDGDTMTIDNLALSFNPGKQATDVGARLSLRSSLGRNHLVRLPPGAQLQRVTMDDRPLSLHADGDQLVIPVEPGSHRLGLSWREARGISALFDTSVADVGARGANVEIEVHVPYDRVVLAVGGPLLGPAVLFWGALLVAVLVAWVLARLKFAPLGLAGWLLLEVGLLQWSPEAAVLVTCWFAGMAIRRQHADRICRGWMRSTQVGLVLLSLLAAAALVATVHAGLLGYPDLMVDGNGSTGNRLLWYADRLAGPAPEAWLLSMPLWIYRLAMLAWALWLARSLLDWVRWGWQGFASGGYWPPRQPSKRSGWFRRRRADAMAKSPEDAA